MTPAEFKDIYLPLRDCAYRLALHFLESAPDAEDAVQDLFLKLWRSRDTLDSVRNPKAYCLTLTRNICVDRIRRKRIEAAQGLDGSVVSGTDTAGEVVSRESLSLAVRAIGTLPAAQREVLRMRVFEDLSYDEIAGRTGMSKLTLRVLLSRARTKIRKMI